MDDALTRELSVRAGRALHARGLTVAAAESCTGGGFCAAITETPGSSAWFSGGFVVYANAAKVRELGVPAELIAERGAVSPEVAAAMAEGARRRFGVDIGVGTTGIAGPSGGTEEKPVGTVFLAVSTGEDTRTEALRFPGDRQSVRRRTVVRALEMLLEVIEGGREGTP